MRIAPLLTLLTLGTFGAACRNAATEPPPGPAVSAPSAPAIPSSHGESPHGESPHGGSPHAGIAPGQPSLEPPPAADGRELQWADPTGWRRGQPSSAMRRAQYSIAGAAGDAELAVFYFGQGQGGAVDENIRRWHGQFVAEPGAATEPQVQQRTVNGLRVHLTERVGRFGGMQIPGAPAPTARDNWAMLGAIVETPQGPWFFKMTGPRATVDAARPRFDELVASFRMP